jgi:predicted DNA-binding transcriptional regulator YafY
MAVIKNALLRYQTLDRCLRNTGRRYSVNDLLNEVNEALIEDNPKSNGIQIRQLRDDIAFMRSEAGYNAPIETVAGDGKKHYYFYSDPKFSINNSPLNTTEANQLKNALTLLQRFEDSPGFEWIAEINVTLKDTFGLKSDSPKVIAFESNLDYSGYNLITPVFNAIVNKRILKVNYAPFGKEPFELEFHPYYLKQYNSRWFVFGFNTLLEVETWNLALDRIKEVKEVDGQYRETKMDWEYYFSEIIGVTKPLDGKEETIELLFSENLAPYIKTKPLHQSQKDYPHEKGLLIRYKLITNYELEQLILSFGESVEVLSPEHLRNKLAERLKTASNHYLDSKN